jgi:hypothetical protein
VVRRAAAAVASLKRVTGNVEKGEAPTLLREHLEVRFDENLNGLLARINLDTNGCVAEINLVASSVRSANDSMGHYRPAPKDRRRYQTTFDRS